MSGHVYFFHNGTHCKIGYTTPDIRERLWAAHVWSPHALNIIGTIASEFPDQLEKQIHLQLAHCRIVKPSGNGEWFDLTIAEAQRVILENENGQIRQYNYSEAHGHPAHHVRPLRRGQQDQAGGLGQDVLRRAWNVWNPGSKRVQPSQRREHSLGCEAFLRQTGAR